MNENNGMKVWTNPDEILGYRLVAMDDQGMILANPDVDKLEACKKALEKGDPDEEAMGSYKSAPFVAIDKIKGNTVSGNVAISVNVSKKEKVSLDFDMANGAEVESMMQAVHAAHPKMNLQEKILNPITAAFKPIGAMILVAVLAWGGHALAVELQAGGEAETSGRNRLFKQVFIKIADVLGPTGVLIIGGLFILITLFWLVRRTKNPPRFLILS